MTKGDVARLLAALAAVDNREPDEAMVEAWHWLLGAYDLGDAMAALRVFKLASPGVWVEPGHLAALVDDWRQQWVDQGRRGQRPAGWPEVAEELIAGPDLARLAGMPMAEPRQALDGGRP